MTAYEILTVTAVDLDFMTVEVISQYRAKLVELGVLGFREICGLSLVEGIDRLDAESNRRAEYAAELDEELARYDGDFTAMLLARFGQ